MIRHTMFDYHHGQSDERLSAFDDGKLTAYLDYSVYEGKPAIKMIKSLVQRKGLARALVLELQRLHPDEEIDWGMLTDDGAALKSALTFKDVVDPVMKQKSDLLARVKGKIAALETDITPEKVQQMGVLWNRLYDMERRLEDELDHAVIVKRIIVA